MPTTSSEPPPAVPVELDLPAPLLDEPADALAEPLEPAEPLLPAEPLALEETSPPEHAARAVVRLTQNAGPANLRNGCGIVIGASVFKLSGLSLGQSDQTTPQKSAAGLGQGTVVAIVAA